MVDLGPVRLVAVDEHGGDARATMFKIEPVAWVLLQVRPTVSDGRIRYVSIPFTAKHSEWEGQGCLDVPEGLERRAMAQSDFENAFATLEYLVENPDLETL